MLDGLLDHQVIFEFEPLDEDVSVKYQDIECHTSIGFYKNLIGNYVLRPNRKYIFSVKVITAMTFKIGVINRKLIDLVREKKADLQGAFSCKDSGFSLFSQGYKQNKNSSVTSQQKVCKGIGPGDVVTFVFDSIKGSLSFYINKQFGNTLFVDEIFKKEEFYPAIAILGEGEKIKLTYYG